MTEIIRDANKKNVMRPMQNTEKKTSDSTENALNNIRLRG